MGTNFSDVALIPGSHRVSPHLGTGGFKALLAQLQEGEEILLVTLGEIVDLHKQKLLDEGQLADVKATLSDRFIPLEKPFRVGQLILLAREEKLHKEARAEFPYLTTLQDKKVQPLHALLAVVREFRGKSAFLADLDCVRLALLELARWEKFEWAHHQSLLLELYQKLVRLSAELYAPQEKTIWTQAEAFVAPASRVWSGHSRLVRKILEQTAPEHLLHLEAQRVMSPDALRVLGIENDSQYRLGTQIVQAVRVVGKQALDVPWARSQALLVVLGELLLKSEVHEVESLWICDTLEVTYSLKGTSYSLMETAPWMLGTREDSRALLLTRNYLPDFEKLLWPHLQGQDERRFLEEVAECRKELESIAGEKRLALGHHYDLTSADPAFSSEVQLHRKNGFSDEDAHWRALIEPGKNRLETLVFNYTSQRGYGVETLVRELLQNIDDAYAGVSDRGNAEFRFGDQELSVLHWGRGFNQPSSDGKCRNDIRRICSLGGSEKASDGPQAEIGRFGLGFKSVFQITDKPRIESHPYYFSIEYLVVPSPETPPQQRDELSFEQIRSRVRFVLRPSQREHRKGLDRLVSKVELEQDLFPEQLLFLRRLNQVTVDLPNGKNFVLSSERVGSGPLGLEDRFVKLSNGLTYLVLKGRTKIDLGKLARSKDTFRTLEYALAFAWDPQRQHFLPLPLDTSPLFLFLPTQENTHLPFLVHGEFATDAGRNTVPYQGDFACNVELARKAAASYAAMLRKAFADWADKPARLASLYAVIPSAQAAVPDYLVAFKTAYIDLLKTGHKVVLTADGSLVSESEYRNAGKLLREAWDIVRCRVPGLPTLRLIAGTEFGPNDVGRLVNGLLEAQEGERDVSFDDLVEHVLRHSRGVESFQAITTLLAFLRQRGSMAADSLEQVKRALRTRSWVLTIAGTLVKPEQLHLVGPEVQFCVTDDERPDLKTLSWSEKEQQWFLQLLGQLDAHSYLSGDKIREVIGKALSRSEAENLARYVGGKRNWNNNYAKVLHGSEKLVAAMIKACWFPGAAGSLIAPQSVRLRQELPAQLLRELDAGFIQRLFPSLDTEVEPERPVFRRTDQEQIFAENLRRLDAWWGGKEVACDLVGDFWSVLGLNARTEKDRANVLRSALENQDQDEVWFRILCAANIIQSERRYSEGLEFMRSFSSDFDGFSRLFQADSHQIVGELVDEVIQRGCSNPGLERAYFWRRIYDFYKIRVLIKEKRFLEGLFSVIDKKPALIAEYLHTGTGTQGRRRHQGLQGSLVNQCFFVVRELLHLGVVEHEDAREQGYYLNRHTRRLLVKLLAPIRDQESLQFKDYTEFSQQLHEVIEETLDNDDFHNSFDIPFFQYHQAFCTRCHDGSPPSGCGLLCKWRPGSQEGYLRSGK